MESDNADVPHVNVIVITSSVRMVRANIANWL